MLLDVYDKLHFPTCFSDRFRTLALILLLHLSLISSATPILRGRVCDIILSIATSAS